MLQEVRKAEDGRVASLYQEVRNLKNEGKEWFTCGWQDNAGGMTVWVLTNDEVEGWEVLYRKED